jgi:hypothetical protein
MNGLTRVVGLLSYVMGLSVAVVIFATPNAAATNTAVVLRGTGSQSAPAFRLAYDSNLRWSCTGCSGDSFVISTDQDAPVNALGPTHGTSFLPEGRYTGVNITASGAWGITFTRAHPRPVRSRYVLKGVDTQNLAPFTLTHDSIVAWSCPECSDQNFVITTDQDTPVNALGPTQGRGFLSKGRYTGVSITASGPWTIIIR